MGSFTGHQDFAKFKLKPGEVQMKRGGYLRNRDGRSERWRCGPRSVCPPFFPALEGINQVRQSRLELALSPWLTYHARVVRKLRCHWARSDTINQRRKPLVFAKGRFPFWVEVFWSAGKYQGYESLGIFDRYEPLKKYFDARVDVSVSE